MSKQTKILIIGGLILLGQLFLFRGYLFPYQQGQIKVKGLACTCPDETVVHGQAYLKSITPDSLKKYELDYSEIFVAERPSTSFDPMGVGTYLIKGQVIGKDRVSEGSPWKPKMKVDRWRKVSFLTNWGVKMLLLLEFIVLGLLLKKAKRD